MDDAEVAKKIQEALNNALSLTSAWLRLVECGIISATLVVLWLFLFKKRRRPDWTIAFFILAMLVWLAVAILNLYLPHKALPWKYALSPLNSIFFALAGCSCRWVNRYLGSNGQKGVGLVLVVLIIGFGVGTFWFETQKNESASHWADVFGSLVAVFALGVGLTVALVKYENTGLAWVAGIAFFCLIVTQGLYAWWPDMHQTTIGIVLSGATRVALAMILSLTATAWSLSESARLAVLDAKEEVQLAVLCIDIRGSTVLHATTNRKGIVADYITGFLEQTRAAAVFMGKHPSMTKSMGDGCLMAWEFPTDRAIGDRCDLVKLAITLQQNYNTYKRHWRDGVLQNELDVRLPPAVGIGLAFGTARRLILEHGSLDYLGRPMNLAARFQGAARTATADELDNETGGIVVEATMVGLTAFLGELPEKRNVKVGGKEVAVFTTTGVMGAVLR